MINEGVPGGLMVPAVLLAFHPSREKLLILWYVGTLKEMHILLPKLHSPHHVFILSFHQPLLWTYALPSN